METSKPSMRLLLLVGLLSGVSIGMALIGWLQEMRGHGLTHADAVYLAMKTVHADEAYNFVGSEHDENLWLNVARFLGYFVEPVAIFALFLSLFRQSLVRFGAKIKRRHVVVVGQGAFADKLSETHGAAVVHLRAIDDDVHEHGGMIRLPFSGFNARKLKEAGAANARQIVIAPENDSQAIDLAIAAQHLYPKVQVNVRLHDYWLARSLHDVPGADRLRAFSEPSLAARYVVRRHPPYLLAQDYGHERIHAVLLGDHDWLEALMAEIIVSACTLVLGKPAFTFICEDTAAFRTRLIRRYPEVEAEADLAFFLASHLDNSEGFDVDMAKIATLGPVTCVYSAFHEGAGAMASALAFIHQVRAEVDFQAPIFLLNEGHGLARPPAGSRLAAFDLVPFGGLADMAEASGLLAQEPDLAERAFHGAYLTFASETGEAARPWDELKEEYRASNRRLVAHIYAKLFEAGFDLRPWMAKHRVWTELPALAPGESLYRSPDERERLAVLEHNRWMADRRMGGWHFGEPRDNKRKLHPDIKPFAQLSPTTQDFDRRFVDHLDKILPRKKGGLKRL